MKRILTAVLLLFTACAFLTACGKPQEKADATEPVAQTATQAGSAAAETVQPTDADEYAETQQPTETEDPVMKMTIHDTPVTVEWEDNEAVQALKELCREQPLTIHMTMYGGFEQVGSIGTALPQSDVQTTTSPGDIVLYAGDQMVVFYGSNTWAYTRLGHITDQSENDITQLLANGDTTIVIRLEP